MTPEQVEDLFLQIEKLHPTDEKETLRDPEFEAEQQRLEEESRGILWEDTLVASGPAPLPAKEAPGEWVEVDEDWWLKHQ